MAITGTSPAICRKQTQTNQVPRFMQNITMKPAETSETPAGFGCYVTWPGKVVLQPMMRVGQQGRTGFWRKSRVPRAPQAEFWTAQVLRPCVGRGGREPTHKTQARPLGFLDSHSVAEGFFDEGRTHSLDIFHRKPFFCFVFFSMMSCYRLAPGNGYERAVVHGEVGAGECGPRTDGRGHMGAAGSQVTVLFRPANISVVPFPSPSVPPEVCRQRGFGSVVPANSFASAACHHTRVCPRCATPASGSVIIILCLVFSDVKIHSKERPLCDRFSVLHGLLSKLNGSMSEVTRIPAQGRGVGLLMSSILTEQAPSGLQEASAHWLDTVAIAQPAV